MQTIMAQTRVEPKREGAKMSTIRHLPSVVDRVETGSVQFGDDWPGFFLRGDNAADLAIVLQQIVSDPTNPIARVQALAWAEHLLGALL